MPLYAEPRLRAQVFQPPSCTYYQYTRRQVQEHFQQGNVDIAVVGDSIMRQLFARVLHMMRGQVALLCPACGPSPPCLMTCSSIVSRLASAPGMP